MIGWITTVWASRAFVCLSWTNTLIKSYWIYNLSPEKHSNNPSPTETINCWLLNNWRNNWNRVLLVIVLFYFPPIRHWCNRVQSPPGGHPHGAGPPRLPHITSVDEDGGRAIAVDDQKSQRRSSDQHLLRRGGEHRPGQRPLLQVRVSVSVLRPRLHSFSCPFFTFLSHIILVAATAPPKHQRLRPWMRLQPSSCGTWAPPWSVWPQAPSSGQRGPSVHQLDFDQSHLSMFKHLERFDQKWKVIVRNPHWCFTPACTWSIATTLSFYLQSNRCFHAFIFLV